MQLFLDVCVQISTYISTAIRTDSSNYLLQQLFTHGAPVINNFIPNSLYLYIITCKQRVIYTYSRLSLHIAKSTCTGTDRTL